MMLCGSLRDRIQPWLRDYVKLQSLAVFLIYIQIGCALIGSLGALYNGVLLINLAIALFALVAIESNSQSLGRTYALLLFCALLLDISWFILFTQEIWSISVETYGALYIFSAGGFCCRHFFFFASRETDSDLRNSFLNPPTPAIDRRCSGAAEEILGALVDALQYNETESGLMNYMIFLVLLWWVNHYSAEYNGSPSAAEASRIKSPGSRSLHAVDEEKGLKQQEVLVAMDREYDDSDIEMSRPCVFDTNRKVDDLEIPKILINSLSLVGSLMSVKKKVVLLHVAEMIPTLSALDEEDSKGSLKKRGGTNQTMEEEAAVAYWCHMCSRTVDPLMEAEIKCPFCAGGFVEEMAEEEEEEQEHSPNSNSLWAPILMQLVNDPSLRARNQSADEDTQTARQRQRTMWILSSKRFSGGEGEDVPFPLCICLMIRNSSCSKEAVEALATVKIQEGALQCSVCLDDFEIGVEAKEMPCEHKFHGDCLLPWLELHSSCPVCRYELPSDETKTETERTQPNGDGGGSESSSFASRQGSENSDGSHHPEDEEEEESDDDGDDGVELSIPWLLSSLFSSSQDSSNPSSDSHEFQLRCLCRDLADFGCAFAICVVLEMAEQGVEGSQPVDLMKHPSGIIPTLQNIVSTVNLDCKLDLKSIALQARNAEYNPKRFAAVIMRIREPKTTALIFASGKMVCTGAKSEHFSKLAARKYARIVQKLGFPAKFKDFKIQNIVGSCDVKFPIRLEGLAYSHSAFSSVSDHLKSCIALDGDNWKIVITGAKMREETYTAFENIYPVLTEFRKIQQ
ncbi:hypothetical protein HID58_057815 [Brassica napus]|uniref:RING-type E3 ubiquitin transferase n=1 Tax=Brassica napus TaxID=3708 RepID=A0ABQ7XGW5_BRANA|nr:hypothetical protein HID58_057815 [Brassica napus]